MTGKLAILGASGRLGRELREYFGNITQIAAPSHEELDITDKSSVDSWFNNVRPAVVINAAAQANVTWCQQHPLEAHQINGQAAGVLAGACRDIGAFLVQYSTDYVFDGASDQPYTESDATNPGSVYGQSKLAGEQEILDSGADAAIVRISRLYGRHGDNFLTRLLRDTSVPLSIEPIKIVNDLTAAPTWTFEIARQTQRIVEARMTGIIHCSSEAALTWLQFAQEILAEMGRKAEIAPCSSTEYFGEDFRPHYSVLANERLRSEGLLVMKAHQEALRECLTQLAIC